MSSINSLTSADPIQSVTSNPTQRTTPPVGATGPSFADTLELTGNSPLNQALQTGDIRTDKVASVRSQIEAGTYETDDKLNAAVDGLLNQLTSTPEA